jgi:hypothetical protein
MRGQSLVAVTLTPLSLTFPQGQLYELNPRACNDMLRKRIDRCGLGDHVGLFVLDASYNTTADSPDPGLWCPHWHGAIRHHDPGMVREKLKSQFPADERVPRPVMVKPVTDLLGWLGYVAKPFLGMRVRFLGRKGRRQTADRALEGDTLREALLFLDRAPLTDRLLLRNLRRRGCSLRAP